MILTVGGAVGCVYLRIEVNGELQDNVLTLDTETGEATVYKRKEGKFVQDGDDLVIEKVTFPVDKLHVYLMKHM